MSYLAALVAVVFFCIALAIGWDTGLASVTVDRWVIGGLIALAAAVVLPPAWPWRTA